MTDISRPPVLSWGLPLCFSLGPLELAPSYHGYQSSKRPNGRPPGAVLFSPRITAPTTVRGPPCLLRRATPLPPSRSPLRLHTGVLPRPLSSIPPRPRQTGRLLPGHRPGTARGTRARSRPRPGRGHAEAEPVRLRYPTRVGRRRTRHQHQCPLGPPPRGGLRPPAPPPRRRTAPAPPAGGGRHGGRPDVEHGA